MGWYRVRMENSLQFWKVQYHLAQAKMDDCQSSQVVRTQLYTLEEYLCNYTDHTLDGSWTAARRTTSSLPSVWMTLALTLVVAIGSLAFVYNSSAVGIHP